MTKPSIPRLVPLPNEISLGAEGRSPIDILRAQTDYWRDLTGGEVVGQVERAVTTPDRVAYWFGFVVPALDDYRYRLFLVEHGLEFYPVWISSDRDSDPVQIDDEESFCNELRARFIAEKTLRIARQLRSLAEEARPRQAANDS